MRGDSGRGERGNEGRDVSECARARVFMHVWRNISGPPGPELGCLTVRKYVSGRETAREREGGKTDR